MLVNPCGPVPKPGARSKRPGGGDRGPDTYMDLKLEYQPDGSRRKVDLDAPEPLSGAPPIHTAVAWGRPEVVAYLLAKGANANALDAEGLTPLQAAKRRLFVAAGDDDEEEAAGRGRSPAAERA